MAISLLVTQSATRSEEETFRLGKAFGRLLRAGDVVSLQGSLGAGKTVFAKGIAVGLGCDPSDVQSPTFTLVREYEGDLPVFHLDIYRLDDTETQLEDIGFEAYFDPRRGVSVIEWGDKAESLLREQRFDVVIEPAALGRIVSIAARGMASDRVERMRDALASGAHTTAWESNGEQ